MFITNRRPRDGRPPGTARGLTRRVTKYARLRVVAGFDRHNLNAPVDRWLLWYIITHPRQWRVEGHMSPWQARIILDFMRQHDVVGVGQIGLNAGHFARTVLACVPNSKVVSYDLGEHPYTRPAAAWLARRFPNRHVAVWGDSAITVPEHAQLLANAQLVLVDGAHTRQGAEIDLANVCQAVRPGTYIVMDDLGGNGYGNGPFEAWFEAIKRGLVAQVHYFTGPHGHAFAIGMVLAAN